MKKIEKFIVKHYNDEEGVIIKGNGFDGLTIGEYREEAEEFIKFINDILDFRSGLYSDFMKQSEIYNTLKRICIKCGKDNEGCMSGLCALHRPKVSVAAIAELIKTEKKKEEL